MGSSSGHPGVGGPWEPPRVPGSPGERCVSPARGGGREGRVGLSAKGLPEKGHELRLEVQVGSG